MKLIIAFAALIALGFADEDAIVLRSDVDIEPEGDFSHGYETSDGSSHDAHSVGGEVIGNFKYTDPEGNTFETTYTAGENGYVATGAHIPEIPFAIARALEWAKTHPYTESYSETGVGGPPPVTRSGGSSSAGAGKQPLPRPEVQHQPGPPGPQPSLSYPGPPSPIPNFVYFTTPHSTNIS